MDTSKVVSFFSLFQNANITQKVGSLVTVLLTAAVALYGILPKLIAMLQAFQSAQPPAV